MTCFLPYAPIGIPFRVVSGTCSCLAIRRSDERFEVIEPCVHHVEAGIGSGYEVNGPRKDISPKQVKYYCLVEYDELVAALRELE